MQRTLYMAVSGTSDVCKKTMDYLASDDVMTLNACCFSPFAPL